jgi:hypothetical protein
MTTLLEAENAVLSRWITQWGTTTPFAFAEEALPSTISPGETAWARVQVVDLPSEQQTKAPTGLRKFLRKAGVLVTIYTPSINQGASQALTLAQTARAVFEGVKFSGLSFFTAEIDRVGPVPPEYLINVIIPFDYVEIK